jgi:hypothetical protein
VLRLPTTGRTIRSAEERWEASSASSLSRTRRPESVLPCDYISLALSPGYGAFRYNRAPSPMRIGIVAFALTLVEVSFAASRAIPAGAITGQMHYISGILFILTSILFAVDKNGAGKYTTISAALADTSSNIYYVYAGNYTEGVSITRFRRHIFWLANCMG